MTAITTAVRLLREAAAELKNAHTLGGDWGDEHEALDAYNEHMATATTLEHMARQCLAQIEEPAKPVAEICSASHDDAEFGERAIKPLRDISGFEYGTQLYAGAVPDAVAPQGDEDDSLLLCASDLQHSAIYDSHSEMQDCARAVADRIKALAAPALEAPAAVAGPAPAGWRLVPATPTREWIAAVADGGYEDCDCASLIADILSRAPSAPALEAPEAPAPAVPDGATPGPWFVRRREVNGELRDCFVAAPDCQGLAYDACILCDDEYHDSVGRKLADCELIVAAVNQHRAALAAAPQAPAAPSDWVAPVRELLGHLSNVLGDEAFAKIDTTRWNAVSALIGTTQAAPAAPAVDALSQAARDVLAERQRQISAEGYEPEADQIYEAGELARAAATYALLATGDDGWRVEDNWPWGMSTLKRAEPRRMLEKAGALILADMERLDRAAAQAAAKGEAS